MSNCFLTRRYGVRTILLTALAQCSRIAHTDAAPVAGSREACGGLDVDTAGATQ
jgi:hypothetical protein